MKRGQKARPQQRPLRHPIQLASAWSTGDVRQADGLGTAAWPSCPDYTCGHKRASDGQVDVNCQRGGRHAGGKHGRGQPGGAADVPQRLVLRGCARLLAWDECQDLGLSLG